MVNNKKNINNVLILFVCVIVIVIGVYVIINEVMCVVVFLNVGLISKYIRRIEFIFVNVWGRIIFYLCILNINVLIVWIW